MKVSFWGSINLSLEILKALHQKHKEGKIELAYVISQPAASVGRKRELNNNPVAQYALDNNLTLYTPEKLKEIFSINQSNNQKLSTDISVIAAYGKIIPQHVLDTAKYGFINFHVSLLPKYRGAIPVPMTIFNQENSGGLTIIKMDAGMDTGPIIKSYKIEVTSDDTAGELMDRLAKLSAEKIDKDFDLIFNPDNWKLTTQNDEEATTCYEKELDKSNSEIHFMDGVKLTHGKIMAGNPQPIAWIDLETLNERANFFKLDILRSKFDENLIEPQNSPIKKKDHIAFHLHEGKLYLELTDGFLEILQVQPQGKNVMDAKSFINGYRNVLVGN